MNDWAAAEAMRDALTALGLAKPLIDQFEAMLPVDSIPLMRQLIDAEPNVIRRLNVAGLSLVAGEVPDER